MNSAIISELPHLSPLEIDLWLVTALPLVEQYNEADAEEILKNVLVAAHANNVPPDLVLAIMEIESHFDRFAISRVGALGIMQIMPFWIDEIGTANDNLMQIDTNVRYGCAILRHYLDKHDNSWHLALAAYNGSSGRFTYSEKVMNVWSLRWKYTRLEDPQSP
ncbi:lytic transglycosylase domain-containing protein [Umboniibacter marinipuniceus]|nr:transglycosylase SLT domain-containing protein [Umboniibacter marinipuniceus]